MDYDNIFNLANQLINALSFCDSEDLISYISNEMIIDGHTSKEGYKEWLADKYFEKGVVMSEERIKERCKREDIAIKIVRGFLEKDCYSDTELFYSLETILNLIEKQQKEIEALKLVHETYKEEIESIEDRYISKDKIRESIKELEEMKVSGTTFETAKNFAIRNLKELLEECL